MTIEDCKWLGRRMVMGRDLNGGDTLFGGRMLEWVDEESAIFVACQLNTSRVVTAHMSEINFLAPALRGDIVEIGCSVVAIGTKSITIKCFARNKATKKDIITVDKLVFVSVDRNGRPIEHGQ